MDRYFESRPRGPGGVRWEGEGAGEGRPEANHRQSLESSELLGMSLMIPLPSKEDACCFSALG